MECIHHRDNDGYCSAAIVGKYFGVENVNFISMQYGEQLKFDEIQKNDTVVIVDFSLQNPGDWEKLLKITPNVIWIDHHITAITDETYPHHLPGKRSTEMSAAELTWEFFFHEEIPYVVRLVGDYDTWKHKYGETSNYFSAGTFIQNTHPSSDFWSKTLENNPTSKDIIDRVIEDGILISLYNRRLYKSIIKYQSKFVTWESKTIIVVNNRGNSTMFNSIPSADYDICAWWYFNGKNFTVTLCSPHDTVDVSLICKKYGGGGHRQIGGFQIDKLPIEFI